MTQFRTLFADEIEVRISQVVERGAIALLYKTARADMNLLDETVGPENWYNTYQEIKGNLFCTLYLRIGPDEWVGKTDCGIESRDDGGNEKKGEASDAFKRSGFRWGIGRELYTAPRILLDLPREKDERGRWRLKRNAYLTVTEIAYDDRRRISKLVIAASGKPIYVWPACEIPESDRREEQAGERARLKTQIMGLANGDEDRVNAYVARLYFGETIDTLDIDQLRDVKVRIAKQVSA